MRGLFLGTLNLIIIVFGGKCDRCELLLRFCLVCACYSRTAWVFASITILSDLCWWEYGLRFSPCIVRSYILTMEVATTLDYCGRRCDCKTKTTQGLALGAYLVRDVIRLGNYLWGLCRQGHLTNWLSYSSIIPDTLVIWGYILGAFLLRVGGCDKWVLL